MFGYKAELTLPNKRRLKWTEIPCCDKHPSFLFKAVDYGATTFRITTLSTRPLGLTIKNAILSIMTFNVYAECCNAECHLC